MEFSLNLPKYEIYNIVLGVNQGGLEEGQVFVVRCVEFDYDQKVYRAALQRMDYTK